MFPHASVASVHSPQTLAMHSGKLGIGEVHVVTPTRILAGSTESSCLPSDASVRRCFRCFLEYAVCENKHLSRLYLV